MVGHLLSYNIHKVYDFNKELIAYSIDVTNINSNEQGYLLISSLPNDDPIMEFSKETYSPYDQISDKNDNCIFSGTCGYYANCSTDSSYYSIKNNQKLVDEEINYRKKYDSQLDHVAFNVNKAKNTRKVLSSSNVSSALSAQSVLQLSNSGDTIILNVPIYTQADNSCCETSAAMALRYDYPYSTPSGKAEIVSKLKETMGYDSIFGTYFSNMPTGIMSAMSYWGVSMTSYNTGYGRDNATLDIVHQQINDYDPLLINDGETDLAVIYHHHSMCIVGYWDGTDYIIVHDTWPNDGNVEVNYNNAQEFGSNFCFTIIN